MTDNTSRITSISESSYSSTLIYHSWRQIGLLEPCNFSRECNFYYWDQPTVNTSNVHSRIEYSYNGSRWFAATDSASETSITHTCFTSVMLTNTSLDGYPITARYVRMVVKSPSGSIMGNCEARMAEQP